MIRPPRKISTDDPDWEEFAHEWNNLCDFLAAVFPDRSAEGGNNITTRGTFRLPSNAKNNSGGSDGDSRWQ